MSTGKRLVKPILCVTLGACSFLLLAGNTVLWWLGIACAIATFVFARIIIKNEDGNWRLWGVAGLATVLVAALLYWSSV